mmetsp:Transcript_22962/g.41219  ORF Transcript_22962/g.41219 Transcript_22962/m.41219 type:complete len:199 (-) Transcript_22962:68-664(-)
MTDNQTTPLITDTRVSDNQALTSITGDDCKQGHRIFGCCDSKRATIIINIIALLLTITNMIILSVEYNDPNLEKEVMEHKTINWINQNYRINQNYTPSMIVNGVEIGTHLIAIFGAYSYDMYLVMLGVVWVIVRLFLTTISLPDEYTDDIAYLSLFIVLSTVWKLIICYPQFQFIHEVGYGIMSPETYPREEHCSCCA